MAAAPAKLYYFKGRSVAAGTLLAAANMAFTSVCRRAQKSLQPSSQASSPTNKSPCWSGPRAFHRAWQLRHAARVGNLYGSTIDEATRITDTDGIMDARGAIVSYPFMDPQEAWPAVPVLAALLSIL